MKVWKKLLLLILTGNILNAGYFKEKNIIYFTDEMEDLEKREVVKNVDFGTFKIFEEDNNFAKDKNNVFYKNKKVQNADVNSFQIENFLIAKDKNSVFFVAKDEVIKINGFSSQKSKVFLQPFMPSILQNKDGIYTFDKYENGEIIVKSITTKEMDIDSLEILKDSALILYLKDKNNVYYVNYVEIEDENKVEIDEDDYDDGRNIKIDIEKINRADSSSFEIAGIYGKDKNSMYAFGKKLEGVNPETFQIISKNGIIFKDDKNIYYLGKKEARKLKNADVNSFEEVAENEYYKDKNNVYYYDEYEGNMKIVKEADSKTFEGVSYTFGKDKNAVYKRENKLAGVDPATFEEIDSSFTKDKNNVYYEEMPMKGVDPKTFEPLINYSNVKDKNGVYSFSEREGKVIVEKIKLPAGIDLKTLKPIENNFDYFKDKNNVYYIKSDYSDEIDNMYDYFEKVEGADVKSFEAIDYSVGKDKNSVYYEAQKINGADVKSFEFVGYNFFKDKNNVYYQRSEFTDNPDISYKFPKIEGADSKSFETIDYSVGKDKNSVYYETQKINGADTISFKSLENNFFRDKKSVYYKNKKLENIKPENFKVINSSLVKQGENLYYNIKDENDNVKFIPLESKTVVDESFEVLDEDYTKDKNNVYFKGKILKGADVETFDKHYNEDDNGYKIQDKNRIYKIKKQD